MSIFVFFHSVRNLHQLKKACSQQRSNAVSGYVLYHVTKQQNIFRDARMALCRPGAFLSLWSRNIGSAWPELYPRCRSPPPHSDLPKILNGGKADGSYHQL